jgi:hypothetical protein
MLSVEDFADHSCYPHSRHPPRSNYPESQPTSMPAAAPSPPYGPSQHEGEYHPYSKQDQPSEVSQRSQGPLLPQQQPPSPRKSMFDFVSPFDHLSSSSSTIKKKPVPAQTASVSSTNDDSGSWTAVSDPKRQSVDNLLEHLARGQPSVSQPTQAQSTSYESFLNTGEFSQAEKAPTQSRVPPPPLPPKPVPNRTTSPRSSPPKNQAQRTQNRPADSPASQQGILPASYQGARRDKESSPGPRGGFKKGPNTQSKFAKNQSSPRHVQSGPCKSISTLIRFYPAPRPKQLFSMYPSHWTTFKLLATSSSLLRSHSLNKTLCFYPEQQSVPPIGSPMQ